MLRLDPTRTAAALAVAASLIAAPAAAHAGGWAPSTPVPGASASGAPAVAADGDGGVLAAFVRAGAVHVSARTASGTFGEPQAVSGTGAGSPALAVNAGGDAVVAWTRDGIVEAAVRQDGGGFGPATVVSSAGADHVRAGIDAAGAPTLAWVRGASIELRRRAAAGAWGPTTQLTGAEAGGLALAVQPDGRATAVWSAVEGAQWVVRRAHRAAADGAWTAATQAPADDIVAISPLDADLAADAGGVTAVWEDHMGLYRETTVVGGRSTGGAFAAGSLSAGAVNHTATTPRPAVAANAGGDAAALWLHTEHEGPTSVQAVRRAGAATAFSAPVGVSSRPASRDVAPDVAVDPQGRVAAVWAAPDGTIEGARASGGWEPAAALSAPGAVAPAVAYDTRGNAVAVWRRGDRIETATHDMVAPQLTGAQAPPSGRAGDPLRFTASATDTESTPSVRWSFGDGATVTGTDVTHAYGAAGTYRVTAVAVDGGGNVSGDERAFTVTIAPGPAVGAVGGPSGPGVGPSAHGMAAPGGPPRGRGDLDSAISGRDVSAPRVGAVKVDARRRRLSLRLSETATLTVAIERRAGRRFRLRGRAITVRAAGGTVTVRLPRLKRGRYRVVVRARDAAGNASLPQRVGFRVR